jgi:hypothetical protein
MSQMKRRTETSKYRNTTNQILAALQSEKDKLSKKSRISSVAEILKFGPRPPQQVFSYRTATSRPAKFQEGNYSIHSLHTLPDLLGKIRQKTNSTNVVLRFLLTESLQLLFGEEGDPTRSVPPHWAITGVQSKEDAKCASAGNVTLNEKNHIVAISNKSGGFHPLYDSLQWVIAVIVANGLEFADKVTITRITPQGIFEDLSVSSQQLKELIIDLFSAAELQLFKTINTNLPTRQHEHRDPSRTNIVHRKIRAPNFDDIPDGNLDNELLDAAVQIQL